eukprot:Gb_09420 [translate_table: standard]
MKHGIKWLANSLYHCDTQSFHDFHKLFINSLVTTVNLLLPFRLCLNLYFGSFKIVHHRKETLYNFSLNIRCQSETFLL